MQMCQDAGILQLKRRRVNVVDVLLSSRKDPRVLEYESIHV